jgi:hypothetical protein
MDPPTVGESSQAWGAAGTASGRIVDPCLRLAATLIASVPSFTKPAAATAGTRAPTVAGLVEVTQPGGLGDQALHAAAQGIAAVPGVGGLLGPEPLLGFLLAAG